MPSGYDAQVGVNPGWGSTKAHGKTVQETKGPVDVLLVGDSITIQWGDTWTRSFLDLTACNRGPSC